MKKTLYLILIISCFQNCSGRLNCSDLKIGMFELKSETGTTIIERDEKVQIETSDGVICYQDIEWLNDCTYILKNHRGHNEELDKEEINKIYKMEIIGIEKDSITIRFSSNHSDKIADSKMKILRLK